MNRFARLYQELDSTTKTGVKLASLREYFGAVEPADAAWAVFFLSGRRLKRLIPAKLFRQAGAEAAGVEPWMVEDCYDVVGDVAETIALLLPENDSPSTGRLHEWVERRILPLQTLDDAAKTAMLHEAWTQLPSSERLVFNKLVTGAFRVGVSQKLVTRSLAELANIEPAKIAHRMMGTWEPNAAFYEELVSTKTDLATEKSRPYPFCLAHALQSDPDTLGDRDAWFAEWKWDGIRGQIIRRGGESFLWSRGEELIHDRFPELLPAMESLPDGVVLDGEVLGWKGDHVLPFAELQRRIGRKKVGKKLLADVPVRFLAFDLLEQDGCDIREQSMSHRRRRLTELFASFAHPHIQVWPLIKVSSWTALAEIRETSRERNVEGLMLKHVDSPYSVGRITGHWWKWKVDPYTCDAVLVYAQRGTGRRASLYTDYTFAVWDQGRLVPFAKAYSGLTDEEIREVDRFVRGNIIEKFGPVRSVTPKLVFELAFENIQRSNRHKSGVAVRFPRIVRWRHDKRPDDADSLDMVKALVLPSAQGP